MLFTEPLFFAFFAVVFSIYWTLRRNRSRKRWLLLCSYFFYAAWDWRFCSLILASTILDFVVGLALRNPSPRFGRRFWLLASLCGNLGLLGFFKYFNFFVESANSVFGTLGLGEVRALYIILPVGISFYTFQTLSYTIDVYRRRMAPISSFLDFAVFVSFFPQLVMGPILRARDFLPQLTTATHFRDVRVQSMLTLFLIGFVKKACISDNIAPFVDAVYADPTAYSALSIWLAVVSFAIQLYCDFSGYADMAIAQAGLLGYRVSPNFAFPFFAANISDFWRQWHISFSSWLRDYLYIPLGGSRAGEFRTHVNLMVTMLLSGLWHGAGWTFIAWGALNAVGLSVHRIYRSWASAPPALDRLLASVGVALTFYWFSWTLVFFRAASFEDAATVSRAFVLLQSPGTHTVDAHFLFWFLPLLAAHWISWRNDLVALAARIPTARFCIGFGLAWALALACVRVEYRPFIYFQF